MRYAIVMLRVAFLVVSAFSPEAAAGGRGKRPDSKALCYIGTPWPWLSKVCGCPAGNEGTNRSIEEFLSTGELATSEIVFGFESARLKRESHDVLDRVGEILSEWPEAEVEIAGHTDSSGPDEYNQQLSEERAESVKTYLLEHFPELREQNLRTAGYGETRPEASNDTEEGRSRNRRVEFRILNLKELKR
jgi:outer membrane protein OmpA-like peptidoglycan-associated protein